VVWPQNHWDGLSVVWPQNHSDGFSRIDIKTGGDGFSRFDFFGLCLIFVFAKLAPTRSFILGPRSPSLLFWSHARCPVLMVSLWILPSGPGLLLQP
jgi:hypothetical protein